MGAADRFKGANTNFSERGERLTPCQHEETVVVDGKSATKIVYEGPAQYRVRVLRCIYKVARDKQEYYIADFEIVTSSNPRVAPGAKRNWMQTMTGKSADVAQKRVTEFLLAAVGVEKTSPMAKQLDSEGKLPGMLAESLDEPTDPECKNALKGCLLDVEVVQDETKDGFLYIKPTFFPVPAPAVAAE